MPLDRWLGNVRAINFIRFPVTISGTMMILCFPLTLADEVATFGRNAGEEAPTYVLRWLLVTAVVLFALAAIAYAVTLGRDATWAKRPVSNAPPAASKQA